MVAKMRQEVAEEWYNREDIEVDVDMKIDHLVGKM